METIQTKYNQITDSWGARIKKDCGNLRNISFWFLGHDIVLFLVA